ncbi:MAG TPA: hypothetical protein VJ888_06850 [Mobilitalea sp.]|nr:hypothetical protein [Mobilitalea sp.]
MNSGLIAALFVMAILTAFTLVILRIISVNTGNKIRDNVITQMDSYVVLIQRKASELETIQKQIDIEQSRLQSGVNIPKNIEKAPPEVFQTADVEYRNFEFSRDYRNLKESFQFDRDKIIREISALSNESGLETNHGLLKGLLDKLTFDNVYKLSVLYETEQLEVIREILSIEESVLLEDYIKENKVFSCLAFYQWLYIKSQIEDRQVQVKTTEKGEDYSSLGTNIQTVHDTNLCEGFQILVGNKLYDYGVRKCELL